MAHPHKDAVAKMPASALIGIIEESKMTYVRENLSIFLHESQIKLLKQVKKHEKPHHKRIRAKQFEKAKKDDLFHGIETLDEIASLENEWEGVVGIDDEDREVLKKLALDSFEISYRHKKKKGFIF